MNKIRIAIAIVTVWAILIITRPKEPPWRMEIMDNNYAIMEDGYRRIYVVKVPLNWKMANFPDEYAYESLFYW